MFNLLKMILYRTVNNRIFFVLALFVTPIVVVGSIIYTNNIENTVRVRDDWRYCTTDTESISYSTKGRTKDF